MIYFSLICRDDDHEQLISNGERFKPAFAERYKKQPVIDLPGISTNRFNNQLCPPSRLSRLRAQSASSACNHYEASPNLFLILEGRGGCTAVPDQPSHIQADCPVLDSSLRRGLISGTTTRFADLDPNRSVKPNTEYEVYFNIF